MKQRRMRESLVEGGSRLRRLSLEWKSQTHGTEPDRRGAAMDIVAIASAFGAGNCYYMGRGSALGLTSPEAFHEAARLYGS
jgi:hypothetical protein